MIIQYRNLNAAEHFFINDKGNLVGTVCDFTITLNIYPEDYAYITETIRYIVNEDMRERIFLIDGYSNYELDDIELLGYGVVGNRLKTPNLSLTRNNEYIVKTTGSNYNEGITNVFKEFLKDHLLVTDERITVEDILINVEMKMSISDPNTIAYAGMSTMNKHLALKPLPLFLSIKEREETWSPECETCKRATQELGKVFHALTSTIFYEDVDYEQDQYFRYKNMEVHGIKHEFSMGLSTCPRYDMQSIHIQEIGEAIIKEMRELFVQAKVTEFYLYTHDGLYHEFILPKYEEYTVIQ